MAVDYIPVWSFQDADDPAAATSNIAVDDGSHRAPPSQVDQCAAGLAGRIGLHTGPTGVAKEEPRGGILKRRVSRKAGRRN